MSQRRYNCLAAGVLCRLAAGSGRPKREKTAAVSHVVMRRRQHFRRFATEVRCLALPRTLRGWANYFQVGTVGFCLGRSL